MLAREKSIRIGADEPFYPSHTGADGGLAQQFHQAELRRARRVGPTAELTRVVTDFDDAHCLAVLLTEQRDRANAARLVLRSHERAHRQVVEQDRVDL